MLHGLQAKQVEAGMANWQAVSDAPLKQIIWLHPLVSGSKI